MAFVINDGCVSCGACAGQCPVGAIAEGDGKFKSMQLLAFLVVLVQAFAQQVLSKKHNQKQNKLCIIIRLKRAHKKKPQQKRCGFFLCSFRFFFYYFLFRFFFCYFLFFFSCCFLFFTLIRFIPISPKYALFLL